MVHKRRRQRRAANSRGKVQTRSFEPLEIDSEPQEQALLSTNNSTAIRKSSDSSPVSIDIGLEKKGDVKYDAAHQAHQTYLEATSLLTPPFQGFSASSNSSSGQENFELLRQIESARNNQYGDLFIPVRAGKSYGRSSKNSDSGYSSYSNNSSAGSVNSSRNSSRRSGSPGSQDSPWYTTYKNLPASLPRVTEPPWGERTIDRRSNEAMEYIEEDFSPYFNLSSAKPAVRPRRRPLSNYTRNPPRLRDIRSLNMGAEKEGLLRHWEDRPGADVAKERQAPPPSPLQSYLNSWAAEEILERRFEKRPLVTHGTPPTLTWMQTPSEPPPPPIRSTPTDNAAVETPRRALRRVKRLTEEIVQPPPPPSGQAYSYQSPATATDVDEEDLTRRLVRALNTPIGQPEPRYVPQKIEEDGEGG